MKIQIPEPCNENWNKMTPTEQGRFCGSCEKEVVDFTSMSKHDIQQYFINITTEATCGRIQNKQLVELNREEKTTSRFSLKPWWIAAATFLFIAKPGFTQGATHSVHTARLNKKPKISSALFRNNELQKEIEIRGTLVDSLTQETLPFVTVIIKGTKQGCSSDIDGNFRLSFAKENRDSVIIEVRFVGYETFTKTVKLNKSLIELDTLNLTISETKLIGWSTEEYTTRGFIVTDEINEPLMDRVSFKEDTTLNQNGSSITIMGYVLDENGDSLPFVNIMIVGTKTGVSSDFDGKFELIVPIEYQDSITLQTSYIGYGSIETKLVDLKKDTNIGVIQFTEQTLKGLTVTHYSYRKPTLRQRMGGFFRRLFH